MTQENKELLLKDLCARLPYDVKVRSLLHDIDFYLAEVYIRQDMVKLVTVECPSRTTVVNIEDIKPYFFPLSSMTEEQESELVRITYSNNNDTTISYLTVDYLIQNHFDYRGLIEKGLAIDATGLNIY